MANKQLNYVYVNLVEFSETLEELRVEEEFTDVTVECESETFKCHRVILAAASKFFRAMFRNNFAETEAAKVVLPDTSAGIFKKVLEFVYSGNVEVTADNVNGLLEASEFLELRGIEERCIEFVKEHKMSVSNTLDMFVFACKTTKKTLIDILSKDIAEQIKIFSRTDQFLELSFHDLNIIVKQWSLLPAKNDELLFGAIVRWVFHLQKDRSQFFDKFFKVIKFENLHSEYMKFIVKELVVNQPDPTSVIKSIKPAGYDTFPAVSRDALQKAEKKLHVYVRCTESNEIKVFSMNATGECSSSDIFSFSVDSKQWIRSVALDEYNMYCLKYAGRSKTKEKVKLTKQSFHAYTSIDMNLGLTLKSPPLIFQDICMCPLENNIYLYNRILSSQAASVQSVASFNSEEINRGIYVYNCELDEWFPVPAMMKQLQDSCMTEHDRTLYLIGGSDPNGGNYPGYAQAYDYRVGQWRALPKTQANFVGADCCSMSDGRIYVCGGVGNNYATCDRYDPNAGKWEPLPRVNNQQQMFYHQAIAYANKLWTMGSHVGESSADNFVMNIYDPVQGWVTKDYKPIFNLTSGTILNGVVFNSFTF